MTTLKPCDEEGILQSIRDERLLQDKKWGGLEKLAHLTDKDMLTVLVEEVGEVAMALNDKKEKGHPSCLINNELIQVAAVAVKWMALRAVKDKGAAAWTPGHAGHRRSDPWRTQAEAALREAKGALKEIEGKKDKTMLGHCCVDKVCQPYFDDDGKQIDSCTHRYGVNRGYNDCAQMASAALAKIEALTAKEK